MERLSGIDVFRVIAAFGVVLLHAGITVDSRLSASCDILWSFFAFVVPFFVCTSLFLSIRIPPVSFKEWFKKYASRLLVPYLTWSMIYFGLRLARNFHSPSLAYADPVGLFLFGGGGGVALYFIPMLFIGLTFFQIIRRLPLFERVLHNTAWCGVFFVLAYCVLFILSTSGNAYDLGRGYAFLTTYPQQENPLARVFFIVVADVIYCLPHLFLVVFIRRVASRNALWFCVVGVVLFALPGLLVADHWVASHMRGDGACLFALGISPWLTRLRSPNVLLWVERFAACTFGVFLSHQLALQALQLIFKKLLSPQAIFGPGFVLAQSLVVFGLICGAIYLLSSRFSFFRWLLAVPAARREGRIHG